MKKVRDFAYETPLPGLEAFHDEFLASRGQEMLELSDALKASDFAFIGKMAHKWKGFANPYGFGILGYIALELEESALEAKLDDCQLLINEARVYLASK